MPTPSRHTASVASLAMPQPAERPPPLQAQLVDLREEFRALSLNAAFSPAASAADGVSAHDGRSNLEVEREAERVVKAHFELLHSYNEVRDAVEVR